MTWTDTLTIVATPISAMIGKLKKGVWSSGDDDAGSSAHGIYYDSSRNHGCLGI